MHVVRPLRERIEIARNMHSARNHTIPYLEVGAVGAPSFRIPGMWSRNTPVHGTTHGGGVYLRVTAPFAIAHSRRARRASASPLRAPAAPTPPPPCS